MTTAQQSKRKKTAPEADLLVGAVTVMRPVAALDLPVLEAWDNDPTIIALMGKKYSRETTQQWFESLATDRTCRTWAIDTHEGRLIGELELAQLNWRTGSAELRVCIGEKDCWSHGYGTDAIRTALRVAFEKFELQSVYLRVFTANERAIRVYERLGFRKDAILQPSSRREDPSPVMLMSLSRHRWHSRQSVSA